MIKRFSDYFLIIIFLVFASYSGYQLFLSEKTIKKADDENIVGKISEVSNVVKLKSDNLLFWDDAAQEQKLVSNDQVYTHDNSSASLTLFNNVEINLMANTLFKIERGIDAPEINLKKGMIYFRILGNKKSFLKFKIEKKYFSISGQGVAGILSKEQNSTKLTIEHGHAEIIQDPSLNNINIEKTEEIEKIIKIEENHFIKLDDNSETVLRTEDVREIESSPSPPPDKKIIIQPKKNIIPIPEPKKPIINSQSIKQQIFIKRIQNKKSKKSINDNKSSFINKLLGVIINVAYAEEFEDIITITWPKQDMAKKYQLEIYQDIKAEKRLLTETVTDEKYDWKNPTIGKIYWRIAIIDKWNRHGPFSDLIPQDIILPENLKPLAPPRLDTPMYDQIIDLSESSITFSWEGAKDSSRYKFILTKDDKLKKIFFKKNTTDNFIEVDFPKIKKTETFYWQVYAWNKFNVSSSSTIQKITLVPAKKKIVALPIMGVHHNLRFVITPNYINYTLYEIEKKTTLAFDGISYASFEVAAQVERRNRDFLTIQAKRTTKNVFNNHKYQDNEIYLLYNNLLKTYLSFPIYLGAGIGGNFTSIFEQTVDDFTKTDIFFYEVLVNLAVEFGVVDYNKFIHRFEFGLGGGNVNNLSANYNLSIKLSSNLSLYTEATISKRFFNNKKNELTLETEKIGIGIKINITSNSL